MSRSFSSLFSVHPRTSPLLLVALYAVGAWVLIALGDWALLRFFGQGDGVTAAQLTKGLVVVLASGGVFFVALSRWIRRLDTVRARLNLVLGQVPGLLWTTGLDLRLISIAGAAAGLDGQARAQPGRPVTWLVEGSERRRLMEAGHRQALAGEVSDFEMDIGGGYFVVRVEPLRADGRIVGCVAFALDASGLRLPVSPHGVRDAFGRSQVLATVGSLILEVGHQLMNPLFAMSSALDAFEARVGDDPRTVRHRALLRDQVERVTALVSGLQEYGRLGSLNPRTCDLGDLLRHAGRRWAKEAADAGVELTLEVPAVGELEAIIDPELFVRALGHLVENAYQHTPPGEQVRVTAERAAEDRSLLRVTVEDAGRGFLEADLGQAMNPLVGRSIERAGLGLAISDRILQLHGGRLDLGAAPGGGALVTMVLHL